MDFKKIGIHAAIMGASAGAAYKFTPGLMKEKALAAIAAGLLSHIITNAVMASMPSAVSLST